MPVSAARISVDPLSVIRLSLDCVRRILRSDHLAMDDSHRAHICLVAHASIPLVVIADSAAEDLAIIGAGAGTAFEGSAGVGTVGTEVFGRDTTTTVGAVAFLERATAGAGIGALAWAGHTGAATGVRAGLTDGTPGGTTLIGTRRGRLTTITKTILISDTTIPRLTLRTLCLTTTPRRVT